MNQKEKKILKKLQSEFPICARPYEKLSRQLGMSQASLCKKIILLKRQGKIRRIGAVIDDGRMGCQSVLIGACVCKIFIVPVVNFINSFPNVTHNYLRDDEYNIWFTFRSGRKKEIDRFVSGFRKRQGIDDVLVLPSIRMFKINAEFKF
ncbi:MAG: Lrp/AsnC family transcriptional regulator [Candidatus Omnitrophica bacterium]|nr:Lrp/AsnC family transcriptional regulator [Candidatus Omnitrophota bacterium]